MKRFTETLKWADPWYRKLPPAAKLLWSWLLDNCDHAGVIEPDLELATFQIGLPMGMDTLSELGERVTKLNSGKLFIPKFIQFQYGELSRDCKAHNPVFSSLEKHGLKGYPKGIHTPQDKDKDKDRDEDKDQDSEGYSAESKLALAFLNEISGKNFRESASSLAPINARLSEDGVTLDGVKQMIIRQGKLWNGTSMAEYLRPSTLFGKEKFNNYYAAKDQPIINQQNHGNHPSKPNPRNNGVNKNPAEQGDEIESFIARQNSRAPAPVPNGVAAQMGSPEHNPPPPSGIVR